MKRTKAVLCSITAVAGVMAVSASPVAASSGYEWINPITAGDGVEVVQPQETGFTSLNATLGGQTSEIATVRSDGTSVNAILGARQPDRRTSPVANPSYRSVNSIPSAREPVPEQTTTSVVREKSGFDFGDALVGAAGAFALALISLVIVQTLRRRGPTAVSRA